MHGTINLNRSSVLILAILLTLVCPALLRAEEAPEIGEEHNFKLFFPHLWQEEKAIWSAPFRKETWHGPKAWILAGSIGGSLALDDGFSRDLRDNESFDDLDRVFSSDELEWSMWALPAVVTLVGESVGRPEVSEYGWKLSEGAVNAFIAAKALKFAAGRERPHTGEIYGFREGGNSFPSGHSIISWTLAEVTVRHFSGRKWVPWVAYPLAGLVSFSRVSSGNHFTSDVVAGSVIGFSIGHWAVK